ncbi:DM13 domain-containing protein [Mycolicibacterium palauense]|uniref:DM13 domain-containing protein n=1 Tax=Mycolicibacterium palauense TaxID=2034511 RepID=UPI000BFED2C1|nr:DM13 domain-containing protein [Mycolicibacterium palauense]
MSGPTRPSRLRFLRHPLVLVGSVLGVVVVVVAAAVGAYWFQPWKLFTNTTVDEPLPASVAGPSAADPGLQGPVVLSQGEFVGQEHDTSGTAQLLRLPDDSMLVRIDDLDTSDGPELKVWLTDAPVTPGTGRAGVFDDGRWVDLGALKGNRGSANYPVPAGTDVTGLDSVSIWCDRFNVSFGAAELVPVA